jgi:hypothetical protein
MKTRPQYLIRVALSLVLLCCMGRVDAQLSSGGIPPSTRYFLGPDNRGMIVLEPPDLKKIGAEDLADPVPYRFAIDLPVGKGIDDSGNWEILPDGTQIWRLTVEAPGALALSVYFSRFLIPEGGRLFVYTPDKSQVLGAFTEENNSPAGVFATALLPGDRVILEYSRPAGTKTPGLTVSEVAWAYRGVGEPKTALGFGQAGPCEVNINCAEGAAWQKEKKGIARIQAKKLGANYWCSGSVVNNTRLDETPYVMTADHCGRGASIIDFRQWIFYFGFETTGCPNPDLPPSYSSMVGATKKATAGDVNTAGSDFLLVLLDQDIPVSYDVTYNGWNRNDSASWAGVCIHHPQGDIRKISTYNTKTISGSWTGSPPYTHWLVRWTATTNGHGVTEGGSSGSPLFNSDGEIIGALTGGESSCDSSNLDKTDYFGKFSYSWSSNGTDSSSRLSYWLDPDNTGIMALSGMHVGVASHTPGPGFTVYPNPFSDRITVGQCHAGTLPGTATVYNLNGTAVASFILEDGRIPAELDLGRLPRGMYILQIRNDRDAWYRKIIKL